MLKTLKDLFDSLQPPAPGADPRAAEHALQLASAVMLVEVMRADTRFEPSARDAARAVLRERFEMPQKLQMDEHMWRIADLLHVPQGAYQNARMRARQQQVGTA